ncbi:MAG: plastocyanin/azurin family copper-binding protein [Phycisphaerales bacterium]|nr:plastocyanin/azurin family copper-binding protein [Phycisphaerales bacterium]
MKKQFATTLTICLSLSAGAFAGVDHQVEVGNTYYDPQWLEVNPGDVITWTRTEGSHNVISGAICGETDGQISSPTLNGTNTSFTWTVPADATENIEYYCSISSHCANGNQYGALILGNNNGEIHIVSTNGFTFDPPSITVSPGDLVIFEHGGGFHSVTFGEDCVSDGTLDEELSSSNGAVLWRVPEDMAGVTQNYFCNPHCGFGMVGSIEIIDDNDCPSDVDGDNDIDVDDLLSLLGEFGTDCSAEDCTCDVDGNGFVDVNDLLEMLGVYGTNC